MPPARVIELQKEAPPLLHKLGDDPDNAALREQLKRLNDKIHEGNVTENARATKDHDRVPDDHWFDPYNLLWASL
jgi:hypothetical protein